MSLPTATHLHLERLARTKRAVGWIALLVGLPLALLDFVQGALTPDSGHGGLARANDSAWLEYPLDLVTHGAFGFGSLVLLASFGLWRMLAWRVDTLRRLSADPSGRRIGVPIFSTHVLPVTLALRWAMAVTVGGALAGWLVSTFELGEATSGLPHWAAWLDLDDDAFASRFDTAAPVLGWAHLVLAIVSALVAAFLKSVDPKQAPEAKGLAAWFRIAAWYGALWAVALLAPHHLDLWWLGADELAWIAPALEGLTTLLVIEFTLRLVVDLWLRFYDGRELPGARVLTDALVPRLFGSHPNPVKSLFDVAAESFGIDLRGTYALVFMRRALLPLAGVLLVCAWIASAFVVVPTHAVGVLQRFGDVDTGDGNTGDPNGAGDGSGALLRPGLHLTAPWPIDRVTLVEVDRVQTTPIGFERSIDGASMLWSESHAEGEYRLVLGDGDELLSVNAVLHWRPADPLAFVLNVSNPREALSDIAHRVVFENTIDRRMDDVLSGNFGALTAEFEREIVDAVADRGLGIEIVDLVMLGMHPPNDVAADYQAVISNQIEGERLVIEARADAIQREFDAEADAFATVARAEAERIGDEAAEIARIEAVERLALERFGDERDVLFELLLYLDALEVALEGTPFAVWHRRLDEDGANLWILDR